MEEDSCEVRRVEGGFQLDFGEGRVGTITDAVATKVAEALVSGLAKSLPELRAKPFLVRSKEAG